MSGPGMRGIPGIGDSGDTAAVTPIIGHAETPGNTPAFLLLRHCPALNIAPTPAIQHLVGRQKSTLYTSSYKSNSWNIQTLGQLLYGSLKTKDADHGISTNGSGRKI